jgi:hypothetical protein
MTFEQWWAHEKWEGLSVSTPAEAMAARRIAAACWNAAIDAVLETGAIENASSDEVEEVKALKNS